MQNPLRLHHIKNPLLRWGVKRASGLNVLEKYYDEWMALGEPEGDKTEAFLEYILSRLNVSAEVLQEELLADVPKEGAFIFVANHPLGGLEGMLLSLLLRKYRPDLKVLTNELLKIFPEFEELFIGVDVLSGNKQIANSRGIRDVTRHISKGGALLVFPAGTVSRMAVPSMVLSDAPWSEMITRLARKFGAPIMPIFVGGQNSKLFYLSGYIHKRLRTLLLPRAMIAKGGQNVPIHIGSTIPTADLVRLNNDTIATSYIRLCCEVLEPQRTMTKKKPVPQMDEIRAAVPQDIVADHIATLDAYRLYEQDEFCLYCAPYEALGPVMEQLAIERERTFREVGEGTGRELDSDHFDPYYQHLFLWDTKKQRIAGGYRIGLTDHIVASQGVSGLYSHSLFHYEQGFIEQLGGAIEMGRSFITPDYQRHPRALDMLWKGIGRFVVKYPQYHTLFGCVSISQEYSKLGSALLTDTFLSHYGMEGNMQQHVTARTPIDAPSTPWSKAQIANLSAIPVLNKLVGRIDAGKSVPVLIRHYLSLNGRFISFTVNEGFNHSLDGLIIVDLRKSPDKYLNRYMSKEGLVYLKEKWNTNTSQEQETKEHPHAA